MKKLILLMLVLLPLVQINAQKGKLVKETVSVVKSTFKKKGQAAAIKSQKQLGKKIAKKTVKVGRYGKKAISRVEKKIKNKYKFSGGTLKHAEPLIAELEKKFPGETKIREWVLAQLDQHAQTLGRELEKAIERGDKETAKLLRKYITKNKEGEYIFTDEGMKFVVEKILAKGLKKIPADMPVERYIHILIRHTNIVGKNTMVFLDNFPLAQEVSTCVKAIKANSKTIMTKWGNATLEKTTEEGKYIWKYDVPIGKDEFGNDIYEMVVILDKNGSLKTAYPLKQILSRSEYYMKMAS